MPRIVIDSLEVEVDAGGTILDAAAKLGIEIPSMCFLRECEPSTSCMVCVVKLLNHNSVVPACATVVEDGMQIESETEELRHIRRTNLELLLSDHLGDCVGPCHNICPAKMNIPRMIRQIAQGRLRDAIATVKEHIALPGVLGRICPAPCEKGCRRGSVDSPVSICLLKRYVADVDLKSNDPFVPDCRAATGSKVAVVGAGPAGLAAAYSLLKDGRECVVFDAAERAGGSLQRDVDEGRLEREVLDAEIDIIRRMGAQFSLARRVELSRLDDLKSEFDAVLLACGEVEPRQIERMGLGASAHGLHVEVHIFQTNLHGVFAAGDIVRPSRMAVHALAEGRRAAVAVDQFLSGGPVAGEPRLWTTHIGRLLDGEIERFAAEGSDAVRVEPAGGGAGGLSDREAVTEAGRCLHCDCRKAGACKLREYGEALEARTTSFKAERAAFEQDAQHADVVYEPGKCIRCGLCVQVTSRAGARLGLAFVGRGFTVRVAGALSSSMADALDSAAAECVSVCPTGALAYKADG